MKTTTKITALMLFATISFSTMVKAEDTVKIPVINKPTILDEGTQRDLTQAQIAELLPWAKDSKIFLADLLDGLQGLSTDDKIDHLVEGIKQVVGDSAPKNSELLMRYALNRGLVLNDILARETSANVVGSADARIRVLVLSAKMAIKYYDTDMNTLTKKTAAPFVAFGIDYFNFLNELNKSIFNASAQYTIQRTALEWLQWDLYRDLNNTQYAPQIVKINNNLKLFPTRKLTDAQCIAYIRQLKKISQQMDFQAKNQSGTQETTQQSPDEQSGDSTDSSENTTLRKNASVVQTSDGKHYHVKIREIYTDGTADVEYTDSAYSGQHGTVKLSELSYSLKSLKNFVLNTNAVQTTDGKHYHVIIREFFADKTVGVEYTDSAYTGQHGTISYRELSYSLASLRNFKPGIAAIQTSGGNHYHVIIREIFADGTINVEYTDTAYRGQTGTVNPSDLALPIE